MRQELLRNLGRDAYDDTFNRYVQFLWPHPPKSVICIKIRIGKDILVIDREDRIGLSKEIMEDESKYARFVW